MAKGVVTCATGDALTGAVTLASAATQIAKAFAPDVTEHFISVLDYAQFKEFLIKTHPGDLNHDLDKLIKESMIRAVGYIKRLYLDKLKADSQLTWRESLQNPFAVIEDVLTTMERDLKAELSFTTYQKTDLENYLTGEHSDCLDQLTDYLFTVSRVDQTHPEWKKLRVFFREQLPLLFDASYKEALKAEDNLKAFKAFQIWVLEEGLKNQKLILADQQKILAELEKLATGQFSPTQSAILHQLDEDIKQIPILFTQKLDAVLVQLNRIEAVANRTEDKVDKVIDLVESGLPTKKLIPRYLTAIPSFGDEFIGRQEELVTLKETLQASSKVVLMNGTGGIGKTTLAKRFVQLHLKDYDHICWIDVTKQDATIKGKLVSGSLKEVLADHLVLFTNLSVPYNPKEESLQHRFELIANALSNLEGSNLLVVDNAGADAGEKAIRNHLPKPPNWQVLITSRQTLTGYTVLPLDRLSEEAATKLFTTHYTYSYSSEEVSALLAAIEYHTLTVELFAKTLEAHHGSLTIADLLQKIKTRALSDPALQRKIETEHHPDETEVYLHLMQAFDCAELTDEEKTLLSQIALLPPESYTAKEQLAPWLGFEDPDSQQMLDNTLNQLAKKGWLMRSNHNFSLHRLLQQIIHYQVPFDWDQSKVLIDSICQLLEIVENPNALGVYPLRRYGEFLLNTIPVTYQDELEVARLKNNLGLVYQALGRFEEAAVLLETALQNTWQNLGSNHPNVAISQSNLATVYQSLGRHEEAAVLLETALQNTWQNLGSSHPNVSICQSNLAMTYKALGHYEEAAVLLETALQSALQNFGPSHPTVANRQSNLAMVYKDLSRFEEATVLLETALQSDQQNFGRNHPIVATRQSNLAQVYQALGRIKEAAVLLETALQSTQQNFDNNHPNVAIKQSNLAMIYKDLGRNNEAVVLLETALQSDKYTYGNNHPTVTIRQTNLAQVYQALSRNNEAAALLEAVLKSNQQIFGGNHPNVAISQSNLALVYQALGRDEEAVVLLETALQSDQQNFGSNHPNVASKQWDLATSLLKLDRIEEAIQLLKTAEKTFIQFLGKSHPYIARVRSWLDYAQSKQSHNSQ
ncbi:tetratricopeptide repeat protein [Spirosoma panaciterrae]|uniref:tetratricopeptide repeat protein n=1 Tax=Spirosoma panaciterrae TaxID=496058 RepID=UPI00036C2B45|nr:tetratricopeptide repeat protein [Spirosoma panaciterrae]